MTYIQKPINIEFDRAKDAANLEKHDISLARTTELDIVAVRENSRPEDEERRFRVYGLIDGEAFCAIVTDRDKNVRAISLRRANRKERKLYGIRAED